MAPLAGVLDCSTAMTGLIPTSPVVDQCITVKCVLVGDGAVGKTSLLASYATKECPIAYTPTAFDNYAVVVTVDGNPIRLHLRDTAGQLELDSLRTLCYSDADVFLLCFNVGCLESYQSVTSRWLPEIRRLCPATPIVLVGTQADRRRHSSTSDFNSNVNKSSKPSVSQRQAERLAHQIGAASYIECSASEQTKVKDVFDTAIVVSLERRGLIENKRNKRSGVGRFKIHRKLELETNASAVKIPDKGGEYIVEQRQRQRGHRWKRLLCCCSSSR